jgi:hypothetical protein
LERLSIDIDTLRASLVDDDSVSS